MVAMAADVSEGVSVPVNADVVDDVDVSVDVDPVDDVDVSVDVDSVDGADVSVDSSEHAISSIVESAMPTISRLTIDFDTVSPYPG